MKTKKIGKLGIFIILLLSLLFASLANTYIEGYENQKTKDAKEQERKKNMSKGNKYDPFLNNKKEYNGIRKSDIIPGTEDMYVLKSEIVPPVCPKCPEINSCPRQKPCQPCKPCGRCPEPAFECKKVPNYNVANVNKELPMPLLNSFAEFS